MGLVRFVLNVLWLVISGLWLALAYLAAAVVCFLLFFLVITIPFGIASLRIAFYVLWPFGRTVVEREDAGAGSLIGNIIWFIVAGWWLALFHIATSIALAVTIIGIPFAWANLKMIPISIMPLGKKIVSSDQSFAYGSVTQPASAQY
ncbi:YccF domain-containing protein [Aldersonia kunmingensis]|uniref:YccF domain-containing protein n=1 Tax=Aldersonia kunmingensis TaxID=408066 RepID=UPI00082C2725|nr:YccF domain-containing protein [Aldersonia kunmingensis]